VRNLLAGTTFVLVWWLLLLLAVAILGFRYMTAMPGVSFRGRLPPLADEESQIRAGLRRHVEALAGEIGERNLWHRDALERARRYIAGELAGLGYQVRAHQYQVWGETVANLDADLAGRRRAEEIVLLGAHYDSVLGCPGAGDNGSGVAGVLEVARLLRASALDRTVRFAAFVNEEPPFYFTSRMGSLVYARECRRRRERVVAMFSLETMGYYADAEGSQRYPFPLGFFYPKCGDFIAFVGNLASRALVRRSLALFRRETRFPSEGVAALGYLPGIYWSDHWAFWRQGYQAVMVTDTAPFRYPWYHTPEDTPEKLDYDRMARVVRGLARLVEHLAGGVGDER